MRTDDSDVRLIVAQVNRLIQSQSDTVVQLIDNERPDMIDRELRIVTRAMLQETPPSADGIESRAINGLSMAEIIAGAFAVYLRRLLATTTELARRAPETITRVIRGTRAESFTDGLLRWRDTNVIRPNLDIIINTTAAYADEHTFEHFAVTHLDHVATLDYRTCLRCYTAEIESPYEIGTQPQIQIGALTFQRSSTITSGPSLQIREPWNKFLAASAMHASAKHATT